MTKKKTAETIHSPDKVEKLHPDRPFFLSLLSWFSFIFFGIIMLLFLLALFNSGWIAEVTQKYLPEADFSKGTIILIITSGFILHSVAFTGILFMWNGSKTGYFLFSVSSILLAAVQLFSHKISVLTTAIYILLIFLFGIFYRRLK